jgi:hypothetical protein
MTAITDAANSAVRDFAVAGVPSSGDHEPLKTDIRAVFAVIDAALASLGVNGAITVKKATRSLLYADLAHAADVLAVVYNDATAAYNGIYVKVGASGAGSWSITGLALPSSFAADLAAVLTAAENVDAAVVLAQAAQSAAAGHANSAAAALEASQAALALAGVVKTFDTKALANAGVTANGDLIMVLADETKGFARTLYLKASGVLQYKVQIGGPGVFNSVSGTTLYGSLAPLMLNSAAGSKNGDTSTGFGQNIFVFAEHIYASDAFGYGALYKFGKDASGPNDAHSGAAFCYQAAHNVERGAGFVVAGVDAAFSGIEINGAVILGRHVLNAKTVKDAEFTGVFVMAEQAFRKLGNVTYLIGGGRFTMSDSPEDGTGRAIVWGNESLRTAKAFKANVSGDLIMASTSVLGGGDFRIVSESGLSGDRNHYGAKQALQTESHGVDGFFLLLEDSHISLRNTGNGFQHGYNVRGTDCLFMGWRAGARNDTGEASPVTVVGAVCLGKLAGYGRVQSGEFYLGNSDALTAHLMWGSFTTKSLNLRSDVLKHIDIPGATSGFADDAAAAAAGVVAGQAWRDVNGFLRQRAA